MTRKQPWITRLYDNLYSCLETSGANPREDHERLGFLPRIGTDTHVRFLVLRTRAADGREVRTPMTPEQAMDLGAALVMAGKAMGMANLRTSSGWIVNTAKPGEGWKTGTASHTPNFLDWSTTS